LGGELNIPIAAPADPATPPLPQGEGRGEGTPAGPELTSGRVHFRKNILSNGAAFVLQIGVGMWFTPYLIKNLGIEAYGLVPLALQVTGYMSLLTVALSGSVGRFLTIDLARGDTSGANRTFNTSLLACIVGSAALLPIALGLSYAAPLFLSVPAGHESDARILFLATTVGFLLTTVGSNFAVSTFAHSRFDIRSGIEALTLLSRVGLVVGLFVFFAPSLWIVGVAILAATVLNQAGYLASWRRLTPQLHIRRSGFDRTKLREMLGMGGWMVVNQAGTLLFLNIDLLVVNTVLGAKAGGEYAPLLQWSMMLRTLAGVIAGVLTPTIIACHARGDHEAMVRISQQAVKLMGLAMALPIGLVCGLGRPLLQTWLGKDFVHLAPLLSLLTAPLCINLAVLPLFSINMAVNKIRWPGIVTVGLGLLNLGLAIVLAKPVGWGLYGVAAAGAIVLTLKNAAFIPLYGARVLRRKLSTFAWAMVPSLIATAAVLAMCGAVSDRCDLASWPRLAAIGCLATIVYAAVAWYAALRTHERSMVLQLALGRASAP